MMVIEKTTTIIYARHIETFKEAGLSFEDIGRILCALSDYDIHGTIPVFENTSLIGFFYMAKKDIDRNREKYDIVVARNRENGNKGGRPRMRTPTGGEEPPPSFSVQDELHPGKKNIVSRVDLLRQVWEKCGLPPSTIITNIRVLNDLEDSLVSFTDEKIEGAIKNYAALISQPGFDESVLPGGRRPTNFKNFLQRWIDRFIDEAKPFEVFKAKGKGTPQNKGPDWGGSVDMGSPVKPKSFFKGGHNGPGN